MGRKLLDNRARGRILRRSVGVCARPGVNVLSLTLEPSHSRRLRREDRGRADVVVYTGGE